jgi:hypothetical protein
VVDAVQFAAELLDLDAVAVPWVGGRVPSGNSGLGGQVVDPLYGFVVITRIQ